MQLVLDGGALLHRIPWPDGVTYDRICLLYADHVSKKYGNSKWFLMVIKMAFLHVMHMDTYRCYSILY